jgi:CheY-like chemotaxis protein
VARILIVEDEDALRAGMSRALSKLGDVTIDAVGTMREALAAIDRAPPDAIISDLDLPDRIGAELLGELEARGLHVPITFVSAYTRELGALIPRSPHVRIVDKPISLEQLREVAKATLATGDSVLPPPPFGAADYLQIACMGRHSVVITVRQHERDELPAGRIVVWRGELWAAKDREGEGEAAFRRLVTHPGAFRCHTLDREPGPRCIDAPWEMLLLDAIRQADEERASAPPEPEPEPYDDAMEAGIGALLRHDHAAALEAFRAALAARPQDPVARANVARLEALGREGEGGGVS